METNKRLTGFEPYGYCRDLLGNKRYPNALIDEDGYLRSPDGSHMGTVFKDGILVDSQSSPEDLDALDLSLPLKVLRAFAPGSKLHGKPILGFDLDGRYE